MQLQCLQKVTLQVPAKIYGAPVSQLTGAGLGKLTGTSLGKSLESFGQVIQGQSFGTLGSRKLFSYFVMIMTVQIKLFSINAQ